jgi:hypothetical protein
MQILRWCLLTWVAAWGLFAGQEAGAVPLFARQTGFQCSTCHVGGNYLELTSIGRQFKLTGYTMGERQTIPLAGMAVAGYSKLRNKDGSSDPGNDFAHDGSTQLQQLSVFTGGKLIDNVGAFVQWTYDGVEHHSALDNFDARFADQATVAGKNFVYGVTLNNSPSVSDVFNSTPAWGYPFVGPGGAFQGYGAQPLLMGSLAQQVAGVGAYADWDNFIYAELAGYQTADGGFSFLRAGSRDPGNAYVLKGVNPYWRLALHGDSGPHSWEVGAFGMDADQYSDGTTGESPLVRYKDHALDAQYQYTQAMHHWSAQATYIHEKQKYDAALVGEDLGYDNSSNTLNWTQLRGGYMYHGLYGGSVTLFTSSGSQDQQLYADNTHPVPDTRGYVLELDYLPMDRVKLGLQYTGYTKFNGSSSNYDASGTLVDRNASDNNTVYVFGWVAF